MRRGAITVAASWELADEITAVLTRPTLTERYRISRQVVDEIVAVLASLLPTVDSKVDLDIRDDDDVPGLAAAIAGGTHVIATGDQDLLTVEVTRWLADRGIELLTPAELLRRLEA